MFQDLINFDSKIKANVSKFICIYIRIYKYKCMYICKKKKFYYYEVKF